LVCFDSVSESGEIVLDENDFDGDREEDDDDGDEERIESHAGI
jgi:hypothetical protein